jgi:hypothetical protein
VHPTHQESDQPKQQPDDSHELDAEILRDLEADDDVRGGSCMPTDTTV